jgi:hypothetical protein
VQLIENFGTQDDLDPLLKYNFRFSSTYSPLFYFAFIKNSDGLVIKLYYHPVALHMRVCSSVRDGFLFPEYPFPTIRQDRFGFRGLLEYERR